MYVYLIIDQILNYTKIVVKTKRKRNIFKR